MIVEAYSSEDILVFWVVMPCGLADIYTSVLEEHAGSIFSSVMETVCFSEMASATLSLSLFRV
jgi:hypothetical protein